MSIYDPAVTGPDFIPLDSTGKPLSGEELADYLQLKHVAPAPLIPQTFQGPNISGLPPVHMAFLGDSSASSAPSSAGLQLASQDLGTFSVMSGSVSDDFMGAIPYPSAAPNTHDFKVAMAYSDVDSSASSACFIAMDSGDASV